MGSHHSHHEEHTHIEQHIEQTTVISVSVVLGVDAKKKEFIQAFQFGTWFEQDFIENTPSTETPENALARKKTYIRCAFARCFESDVSRSAMRKVFYSMNQHCQWNLNESLFDEVVEQMFDTRDNKARMDKTERTLNNLATYVIAIADGNGKSVRDKLNEIVASLNVEVEETNTANNHMETLSNRYKGSKAQLEQRMQSAIQGAEQGQAAQAQQQIQAAPNQATPEQADEAAKKQQADEAAKKQQADEAAAKQQADEAAAKQQADETAKKQAEEAAAKQQADEAAKKQAEEAAAKQQADEAAKKQAEEAAAKQQADEAAKKQAEDAAKQS